MPALLIERKVRKSTPHRFPALALFSMSRKA
jgi:hypothetical protein